MIYVEVLKYSINVTPSHRLSKYDGITMQVNIWMHSPTRRLTAKQYIYRKKEKLFVSLSISIINVQFGLRVMFKGTVTPKTFNL